MKRFLALALTAALPAIAAAEPALWSIDPAHSDATFSVRHLVISTVRGHFGKTTGKIMYDENDVSKSSVEATVDASTIDTRVPDRDAHLKSPDFFDVAKYPTLTFKSTKVEKVGDDKLKVTGDLTMKGTTKPVTWDVTYTPKPITGMGGELRRGFNATTKVNRQDFGLKWSKTVEAGPVVGDEVTLNLDAEAVKGELKKPQAKAAATTTSEEKKP
jgi:polyisoprenoid-binding protein YceI